MITIAVNPLIRDDDSEQEVVRLDIVLKEEDFLSVYDRLQVWKSVSGSGGPYTEVTAAMAEPARVPRDAGGPSGMTGTSVALDTLELELLVNERDEITVVFSGTDPISYADAATQITAQGLGKVTAHVDAEGLLAVQTAGVGTTALLRVVGGDAAPQLQLPEVVESGRDSRIALNPGQERYLYLDYFGSATAHYKTRFFNSSNEAVSAFSLPFSLGARIGLGPESLICGFMDLVQVNGKPLPNREVRLHSEFDANPVDGRVVAGGDIIGKTDGGGHVEFRLIRGQRVTVAIPGSDIVRTITVPTDPSLETFSLLDPDIADDDIFKAVVPDLVVAERRSLE